MGLPACSPSCSSAAPASRVIIPLPLQPGLTSLPWGRPDTHIFMSFGRALFVAWCVWIGTLVAGAVAILLLDKTEWRVAVGMSSLLVGFLALV